MKQNGFGIASLVLGIIGMILSCIAIGIVPSIIGFVLAIIGLSKKDSKHGTAIAGLTCSVIGIGIFLLALFLFNTDDEKSTVSIAQNEKQSEDISTESNKVETEEKTEQSFTQPDNKEGDVEILAEYTLPDGIGWYTRHFMVIKNNSNETVDVSTSSLAYSEDGTMVGASDADFDALGSGCVSVLYEAFEVDSDIDHYETELNATESKYYESVIQDLSYVQNDIENGAVFQVTNDGGEAVEFVEGYALFFLGDELVGYESAYFTDDDYELKPGETISKQMTSYDKFDKIEFYLTGRK